MLPEGRLSYANGWEYCVAAHRVIVGMQKVPDDVMQAIRAGRPIADRKLETLRRFTAAVVNSRGWPPEVDTKAFLNHSRRRPPPPQSGNAPAFCLDLASKITALVTVDGSAHDTGRHGTPMDTPRYESALIVGAGEGLSASLARPHVTHSRFFAQMRMRVALIMNYVVHNSESQNTAAEADRWSYRAQVIRAS